MIQRAFSPFCLMIFVASSPSIKSEETYYHWLSPDKDLRDCQRAAIRGYTRWFISAQRLVKEYLPEKELEFNYPYKIIIGLLKLKETQYTWDKNIIINKFIDDFDEQRNCLLSIPLVAEINQLNLKKIIAADFVESEIEQAELLLRNGFDRAAGAIAGVALEKHLKMQCEVNEVLYKYKDTIEPLAQALHSAGKLDDIELKRIIYLGGIRNDCAHPNDVSKDQVRALIEQVKKIVV